MPAPNNPRVSFLSRLVKASLMGLYRLKGWTLTDFNAVPPRCIILGVPHTTNWDFVFFLGVAQRLGIQPSFMGKRSLFAWPMIRFMHDMGGIPVDRSRRANYVEQVIAAFAQGGDLALVIAPEGTRGKTDAWRSGFYHIAHGAGVPIVPAWVNHAAMTGGVGPAIVTTGDFDADLKRLATYYRSVLPDDPKLAALYRQAGLEGFG